MDLRFEKLLHNITPPLIKKLYKKFYNDAIKFEGSYRSWDEAVAHSTGYDADYILSKVKESLSRVKSGEAAYERDSILFYKKEYPFPVLAGLLHAAVVEEGKLSVLDFGGSLGSTYFQCREFLANVRNIRWSIVEQNKFVECGRRYFETDELKFYYTIESCLESERPNVALLSGVLQYISEPHSLLREIISKNFRSIIIDRTPFSNLDDDLLTVEVVPASIYSASYPVWLFNSDKVLDLFQNSYSQLAEFPALDGTMYHAKTDICFKGYIYTKKHVIYSDTLQSPHQNEISRKGA